MSRSLARARHLARRCVTSMRGRKPQAGDLEWAATVLTPPEMTLFRSMSPTDQAHSLEVARLVQAALSKHGLSGHGLSGHGASEPGVSGPGASTQARAAGADDDGGDWALAAALMHDIGKVEAAAGVALRVVSTLIGGVVGDSGALRLSGFRGPAGRLGRHIRYPMLGASLLGAIGSHELVRAWAAQHHSAPADWTVPHNIGEVLRDADDAAG